jgi:mycoredoxin
MDNCCTTTPNQIVMYITEHCSDCRRAKAYFAANHIPFLKISLEENEKTTEFVTKLNNGFRSVPTIIFPDGSILVEPGWEELRAKFSNS